MALSATLVGSASSTTSGTSITATTTASVPANATILIAIASDNSNTGGTSNLVSPSVPSGVVNANPGINLPWSTFTRTPGGVANDGAVIGVWVYNNGPSTLASGAAFSVNFGTTTSKAIQIWYLSSSVSGSYANKVTGPGNTGSGTSPTFTTSVINNHLAIGFLAHESNSAAPVADTDTTNGTWSSATQTTANTGTSNTSMILYSQYKVVTATGNQTWNQSGFTSSDYANIVASFQEVTIPTASGSPTLGAATASVVGAVISPATGTGAATLSDATAVVVGSPVASGAASATLSDATATVVGSPVITSTADSTLSDATVSGVGTPVATISGTSTLGDATASATGAPVVTVTGTSSLGDATGAATGSAVATGTAASTLGDATGAVSGAPVAAGTAAVTLGDATSSATATSVFSPSQLSPVLWLDASDTATITQSANAVSSWLDKSTNARTFTQSTASAKPTTNTRTVNGKNVVDFDGNDILVGSGTTTDWKFLHDGTIYLIAAAFVLDTTTTTRYLLSSASTSLTTNGAQMVYGSGALNYYIGGTTTTRRALYNWGEPPIAVGSLEVVGVLGDPSQAAGADRIGLYADGYPVSKAGAGNGTLSTANAGQTLRIGGLSTTGSWDGAIAEIVVLTGANATDANWQKLNTYLATKWGGSTVIYTDLNLNYSVGSWSDLTFTGVSGEVTSVYTATAIPGEIIFSGNAGDITVAAVLSGSPTLANATTTAVGSPVATGTGASSLGNASSSVTGSPIVSATGATSLADATASATARLVASGTAAPALANATAVVTGTPIVVGTATSSLGAATSNVVATTTVLSSGSVTLGAAVSNAVGVAGVESFALITLADATASASARALVVSTGTPTLGPATGNATGAPIVTSSGSITLGAATGTAQAVVIASGSVGVSLVAATASAQGTVIVSGAEATTLSPATAEVVGSPVVRASGSPTLQNATATGLQSFPQTINNAQGTFLFSGYSSYSNIGTFTFVAVTGPTLGLITITAVSGRTQTGVISLSGNHPTPVAGPITVTQVLGEFTLEARSSRPSEGFLAVTAEFNLTGASRPPEITKHLAVWDGEWKIARFKEWSGSGWVESPRVKAYGVSGDFWEKVF